MHRYSCYNAAMATTAATAKVTTGTALKTMLQIATPSSRQLQLISWGFSLDAPPATTSTGVVELIQTDVAATVTAHLASGVQPLDPNAPPSLVTLGTAATGYSASVEGTPTGTRLFDAIQVPGLTAGGNGIEPYAYQFMPDERPIVGVSKFLRIRATFAAAVNLTCWATWDE
ncbi:hypothetical protein [Actinacidiphila rubida]|uniref:Uncharacterized protein n=1 Tax=Actinacidiphila rubida TaxID=310780 RepID=A0A1H8SY82_9ACTN|nr:hypothetical protein [Actinacidiphila rubida]SEO83597.1 hypothetical protein SAMN05216267_104654 [Actinacidiphila rubida]